MWYKLLNYVWRLWFVILAAVLVFLFLVPVLLLSIRKNHLKYAYFFIRSWCVILFYGMGFRYQIQYNTKDRIDNNRKYIFISNHTSIMDIMLMAVLHPHHPITFIGKAELAKIPVFGIIYRRICILVDRTSAKSRAMVYVKAAEKMNEGQNIVIFPEGGVPEDEAILLDDFKDGAFILSAKHQFPILVYTFIGLKEMFPFTLSKGYPGKVKVVLNEIMQPAEIKIMKEKSHHSIKKTLEEVL